MFLYVFDENRIRIVPSFLQHSTTYFIHILQIYIFIYFEIYTLKYIFSIYVYFKLKIETFFVTGTVQGVQDRTFTL